MVELNEIQVEKHFVTASGQMRKVVSIDGNDVTYESWSAKQERPNNPTRTKVNVENFCQAVERSVPKHYRADFG